MIPIEQLTHELPDPAGAERFLHQLEERFPPQYARLMRDDALASDVVTLAAYSRLIAATLLRYPEYIWWLSRRRRDSGVRSKEELLESLARFSLTNSQVEHSVLLARFRWRELIRIFLADIRRLLTVAEITEGISNLADAILENAARAAEQALTNRFGVPQAVDEKGRISTAGFVIVSLGKLGSRELNYSSDIDLLFIHSSDGMTSASGTDAAITNNEYYSKLSGAIIKLVGGESAEGSAYRVDMRLRPHGSVGSLSLPLATTTRYYKQEAAAWERQVLIRSRASAGDGAIFQNFIEAVADSVFERGASPSGALAHVRRSKQRIDRNRASTDLDVKLSPGGIREIEFIAQALQLAYGGRDPWLRVPHTLISLSRLADRGHLSRGEVSELFDAYEFLRRLEHTLQMEDGLQTHTLPSDVGRQAALARKMRCGSREKLHTELMGHMGNVHRVFQRIFAGADERSTHSDEQIVDDRNSIAVTEAESATPSEDKRSELMQRADRLSPRVCELLVAHSDLEAQMLRSVESGDAADSFDEIGSSKEAEGLGGRMRSLRRNWLAAYFAILVRDAAQAISIARSKTLQTKLAEASMRAAYEIAMLEFTDNDDAPEFAVLGLGKLGSGGLDHQSDLDLVLVHRDGKAAPEKYARAVDIFTNTLSSVTRDGSLYRIDLRLRPFGKSGQSVIGASSFVEYVDKSAAVWELLAYLKIRAAGGDLELATSAETSIRDAIRRRVHAFSKVEIALETARIRYRLEAERAVSPRHGVDIKFGAGGLLDVYFAVRFLQLSDDVHDRSNDRSTDAALSALLEAGSLTSPDHATLQAGYAFLSRLDHFIRLADRRTSRLPSANRAAIARITEAMGVEESRLMEELTSHRLEIRNVFEKLTGA